MTDILLPVQGVSHAQRISKTIQEKPYRITGGVVAIENKSVDVNSIYANVMAAHNKLIGNMREAGYLGADTTAIDDFTRIGFPAQIPNLSVLDAIDLIIGVRDGMLVTEIFFQYKGSTAMLYTTEVHTSNTIKASLPGATA